MERWRGYVTSRFFVLLDEVTVLESKPFRWRRAAPPPDSKRARSAYDELVARLEAEGWSRFEHGSPWYATTFARTVRVPVSRQDEYGPATAVPTRLTVPQAPALVLPRAEEQDRVEDARQPAVAEQIAGEPPSPARRRRRRRSVLFAVPVAGAVGAAAFLLGGGHASGSPPPARHLPARSVAAAAPAPASVRAPSTTAEPRARLGHKVVEVTMVGRGTGSWVQVRRGSAHGPVLYEGVLTDGKRLQFRGPRLWTRFGAAGNLAILADGRPFALTGTSEQLFRPSAG